MLLVLGRGEITEHLARRPVEDEFAALVEQQRLGEHLEELRVGLMDRHQDDLVVGHRTDDVDDVLAVLGAEAAGGFVEEEHVGGADHVQADVEPFAFPAGEPFLDWAAHHRVAAFTQAELDEFALDAPGAVPAGEMGGADGGGELEVFLDGEVLVEGVVLGDVRNEAFEFVELRVEGLAVEQDLALAGLELSGDGPHERGFAAAAGAHHADHLAPAHMEGDAVEAALRAPEPVGNIPQLEAGDDVAFLLDDALREVAAQHLARVDADAVAVAQFLGAAHRHVPDEDRAVGLDDLQFADLGLVIAEDLEQHLAAGARREQDVVHVQERGVVGDEVAGFVGLELEPAAEGPGPSAKVAQGQFGVVVEHNPVVQAGFRHRPGSERHPVEQGVDGFEGPDLDLEAESDLQNRFPGPHLFELHFVVVVDAEIDLGEGDVFFGVKIIGQVLVGEHLFAQHDALAGVDPAERPRPERAAPDDEAFGALVFEKDQVVVSERDEAFLAREALEFHVGDVVGSEGEGFERGLAVLIDRFVGLLVGVELVNDVDGLRRHAQERHKPVVGHHLLLIEPGLGDEVVELDPEHDLAFGAQLVGQLKRHRVEVLLFVERLPKEFAQFRVHRLRVVIPQEPQRRVDFLLQHVAPAGFRERRQHLDEQGQQVGALGDRARLAQEPPLQGLRGAHQAVGERMVAELLAQELGKAGFERAHRISRARGAAGISAGTLQPTRGVVDTPR